MESITLREWLTQAQERGYRIERAPEPGVKTQSPEHLLAEVPQEILSTPVEIFYLHDLYAPYGKSACVARMYDYATHQHIHPSMYWLEPRWELRDGQYQPPTTTAD